MSIRIADIIQMFDQWAPPWVAWEKDNIGLQIGNRASFVSKILVTLEVTESVISEAVAQHADLIISHHPLFFRPPKTITVDDPVGKLALRLAENKIALFSAHTNLDFTKDGVSCSLAKVLGLKNIRFLTGIKDSLAKIVVFVPENNLEIVRNAMSQAGAGVIGEYTSCSFSSKGTGSFQGSAATSPFIGKAERLEVIDEIRLEMIAPRALVNKIVHAMKAVHPYEEVAYDIVDLKNSNPNYGMGACGSLPKPQPLGAFLKQVKQSLHCEAVRYTGEAQRKVHSIAVCGGSGSDLLPEALSAKADVFITADVRYHTFQTTEHSIALVDAGHWETEHIILEPIVDRLKSLAYTMGTSLKVAVTKQRTNPIHII